MIPNMTIFGIEETNANRNKFCPHYKILNRKLYPKSRLVLLNPKSVMFTREAFETFDFWNLDSDFFFAEDALSFNEMHNWGSNHFAYFSLFLKVLRVAHGYYDEDFFDSKWTKNKAHLLDIFSNFLQADVLMVSPVLKKKLDAFLPNLFSDRMLESFQSKYLVLPPPDFYKFEPTYEEHKSFKTLTFLWNHRFMASKNPKLFFSTIQAFCSTYPKVPVKVLVLSNLTPKELGAFIPESIMPLVAVRPWAYDDAAYEQALKDSNITVGTSLVESYGIAVLEPIKYGSVVLNAVCNEAYTEIMGAKTSFKPKELPEKIYKVWSDVTYRKKLQAYNRKGLEAITDASKYQAQLKTRLASVFQARMDRTSTKSPKLQAVLKALSKKALTKNEVYEVMGWKATGKPVNSFWGDYYYGLRKLGVRTAVVGSRLYFYTEVKPKAKPEDKSRSSSLF